MKNETPEKAKMVQDVSDMLLNQRIPLDIYRASNAEIIVPAGKKIGVRDIRKLVALRHDVELAISPVRTALKERLGIPAHPTL